MIRKFSKPSGDISKEFDRLIDQDRRMLNGAAPIKQMMREQDLKRVTCTVCETSLDGADGFDHQKVPFVVCPKCSHVQSRILLGQAGEQALDQHLSYSQIYPTLEAEAYFSRRDAVYKPKLDFLFEVLDQIGGYENLRRAGRWLEIGSGAGYLLSALEESGCQHVKGLDRDAKLLASNKHMLSRAQLEHSLADFYETVSVEDYDVLIAIFVLEHIEKLADVARSLKAKPKGSVFYFSVPHFGFATAFETTEPDHAGRNMDGLVHQQIFTEQSLTYFLNQAGYEKVGEWVFGQDMMDLVRFLTVRLKGQYPDVLLNNLMSGLNQILDPVQEQIDRACLADARHVVAIKK